MMTLAKAVWLFVAFFCNLCLLVSCVRGQASTLWFWLQREVLASGGFSGYTAAEDLID